MTDIAFTKVDLPFGWLGNMSPHPVRYDNKLYKTTESLFQVLRFEGFPEIQEEIRVQPSPMSAKMVAKKHKKIIADRFLSEKEREANDLKLMKVCLQLKIEAHPNLKKHLLLTKDARLIEDCSKRPGGSGLFWGMKRVETLDGFGKKSFNWVGRNELGNLWMELRNALP